MATQHPFITPTPATPCHCRSPPKEAPAGFTDEAYGIFVCLAAMLALYVAGINLYYIRIVSEFILDTYDHIWGVRDAPSTCASNIGKEDWLVILDTDAEKPGSKPAEDTKSKPAPEPTQRRRTHSPNCGFMRWKQSITEGHVDQDYDLCERATFLTRSMIMLFIISMAATAGLVLGTLECWWLGKPLKAAWPTMEDPVCDLPRCVIVLGGMVVTAATPRHYRQAVSESVVNKYNRIRGIRDMSLACVCRIERRERIERGGWEPEQKCGACVTVDTLMGTVAFLIFSSVFIAIQLVMQRCVGCKMWTRLRNKL